MQVYYHRGKSRTARKRRKRAALLSQRMRHSDGDAAFRLKQRQRALNGVAKYGNSRVELMNQERLATHQSQHRADAARLGGGNQKHKAH